MYRGPRTTKQANRLYGLYKQASVGDCKEDLQSNDINKLQKREEWRRLFGTPKEMAKRRFITYLAEIDPSLIHVTPSEKPPGNE